MRTAVLAIGLSLVPTGGSGQGAGSDSYGGWAELSLPATVERQADVPYARVGDRVLSADVYRLKERASDPAPAVVLVHGGAFVRGSKWDMAPMAAALASEGFVAVSIEYRLGGEAPFPSAGADVSRAVRWVRSEAAALGIDPSRIALVGGSAGAHLAALAAMRQPGESDSGEEAILGSEPVQALVALATPADLPALGTWVQEQGRIDLLVVGLQFFGVSSLADSAQARSVSPINHASADDPPVLLLHGADDSLIPVSQSEVLADRLRGVGVHVEFEVVDGAPHPFWHYNRWAGSMARRVADFLRTALAPA